MVSIAVIRVAHKVGVSVPTAEPSAFEDCVGAANSELPHTITIWAWGEFIRIVVFALVFKRIAAGGAGVGVFRHWDDMFLLCG